MPPERNDDTPLRDAISKVIVELVRFGLEQIGDEWLPAGPIAPGAYNLRDACEYLGVGVTKFKELGIRSFALPGKGRERRWPRVELDRYIQRQTKKG